MKLFSKRTAMIAIALLLAMTTGSSLAQARNGQDDATPHAESSSTPRGSETPTATQDDHGGLGSRSSDSPRPAKSAHPEVSERPEASEHPKLDDAKRKVCDRHQGNVNGVMDRIDMRAAAHDTFFNTVFGRVKTFAASHEKPANYDALVATATTAGAKVDADLASVKAVPTFTCAGTDPKGNVSTYKTAVKAMVADLKAYREAIKTLIMAVKQAQPAASEGK